MENPHKLNSEHLDLKHIDTIFKINPEAVTITDPQNISLKGIV